jgi:hypothetical protein
VPAVTGVLVSAMDVGHNVRRKAGARYTAWPLGACGLRSLGKTHLVH